MLALFIICLEEYLYISTVRISGRIIAQFDLFSGVYIVLNPIDMRDRDLILIISFVMHFTGIEGHSFLWLEKFPVAFYS